MSHRKTSAEAFAAVAALRESSKGFGKVRQRLEASLGSLPGVGSVRLVGGHGRGEEFGGLVLEEDWERWGLWHEPGHGTAQDIDDQEIAPCRFIVLGVELWRNALKRSTWRYSRCSLVYVGHQPATVAQDPGEFGAEMRRVGSTGRGGRRYALEQSRLWVEKAPPREQRPWADRCWFYLLPLTTMRTPSILKSDILRPIQALLSGLSVTEAFRSASQVIHEYPSRTAQTRLG